MKKLSVLIFLLFLAVLLTACTKNNKQADTTQNTESTEQEKTTSDDETLSGSLFDLAQKGVPMHCVAKYSDEEGESSVDVYVSGKKMNNMVTAKTAEGEEMTFFYISDGEFTYTWAEGETEGMKMKYMEFNESELENMDYMEDSDVNESYKDMAKDVDYKCSPWIPSDSKFTPPSDINFMDLSTMMDSFSDLMSDDDTSELNLEDACSICDSLPEGEARDECKAGLGC